MKQKSKSERYCHRSVVGVYDIGREVRRGEKMMWEERKK